MLYLIEEPCTMDESNKNKIIILPGIELLHKYKILVIVEFSRLEPFLKDASSQQEFWSD